MRARIGRALRGTAYGAEYLCVAADDALVQPSSVLLGRDGSAIDVTASQRLVGLKPVLIAVSMTAGDATASAWAPGSRHALALCADGPPATARSHNWRGFALPTRAFARLELEVVAHRTFAGAAVAVLRGVHGEHDLLPPARRAALALDARLRELRAGATRQPDPLRPEGNGYDQLRIGYSTPRPVVAISVRGAGGDNLAPLDLQGPVGRSGHLVSLRDGARLLDQVVAAGGCAVSALRADDGGAIYRHGRRHMAALDALPDIPLAPTRSPTLGLPLFAATAGVRELHLVDHTQVGHRHLLWCEVVAETPPAAGPLLSHLHFWYAMWLEARGTPPRVVAR